MNNKVCIVFFFASSFAYAAYTLNYEIEKKGEKIKTGVIVVEENQEAYVKLDEREIKLVPSPNESQGKGVIKITTEVIERNSNGKQKTLSKPPIINGILGYASELSQNDEKQKLNYRLKIVPTQVDSKEAVQAR